MINGLLKLSQESDHERVQRIGQGIKQISLTYVKDLIKTLDGSFIAGHSKPVKTNWRLYSDHDTQVEYIFATLEIQYPPYGVMVREITYRSSIHFRLRESEDLKECNIYYGFPTYGSCEDHKDYYAKYKKLQDFNIEEIENGINLAISEASKR